MNNKTKATKSTFKAIPLQLKIINLKDRTLIYATGNRRRMLGEYFINGEIPEETHCEGWYTVKGPIKEIKRNLGSKKTNHRMESIDPQKTDKLGLPRQVPRGEFYDEDYEISEKYSDVFSLYREAFDTVELGFSDVDFQVECIGELEEFKDLNTDIDMISTYRFKDTNSKLQLSKNHYDQVVQALIPGPMLHTMPVKLSSKETYDIIRAHVKKNIDVTKAKISSDYDFCFDVKKLVSTAPEVKTYVKIFKGTTYKKTVKARSFDIFSMTHDEADKAGGGYKGYPLIEPFSGKNKEDLINNINTFLDNLMEQINRPLKECPKCSGYGVVNSENSKNSGNKIENAEEVAKFVKELISGINDLDPKKKDLVKHRDLMEMAKTLINSL